MLASSPCIDAGDPSLPLDPDSTIADIGALTHVPIPYITVSNNPQIFGSVQVGQQLGLPLTIYNLGDLDLILYNITTNDPCYFTDFNPVDSLITPGDSLTITVTFAPQSPIVYVRTLTIENNDELLEVSLLGLGEAGTGILIPENSAIPNAYALHPPYPNPFNPETTLSFDLPHAGIVTLNLYDLQGQQIMSLQDGWLSAGSYMVVLNATNLTGGVYFARLTSPEYNRAQKLILLK